MAQTAQSSSIGAYTYSDNKELFEIQRGNNFEFVIDSSLNGISAFGSSTKTFPNAQEYIRLSVHSAPALHYQINPITVSRGNTQVKYAGVPQFNAGSLVVKDFIGAETKDILMAWQAQAANPLTQTVGQQKDYKVTANLIEYTPDYSQIVRTWQIDGCWVSDVSESDFSVDENGERRVTATIQYDRAYPVYE